MVKKARKPSQIKNLQDLPRIDCKCGASNYEIEEKFGCWSCGAVLINTPPRFPPKTLEEYLIITGVDEELRPRYRKWLQGIMRRMIPKEMKCKHEKPLELITAQCFVNTGWNACLSDIKENIKKI